ncbi:MAG: DHHA1 domain-containing protein [Nanoarchaeota archaeon]|jgi:single-stranded DNA-specific DHH superfamily exonuclease|nr:DHHA1 domain-containing protein [Nanoarchaeota archaeon]
MITIQEVGEVRELLQNAAKPLFYFDNDQDGLSSYLLLRRMIGRGNGIPVKTSPLDMSYYRRVGEFNPDIVFILDQPTVLNEFFEKLEEDGIKVVWIDHHENDVEAIPNNVHYYNPLYSGEKENIPVTAVCYEISRRKEDLWIAVVGTIADKFVMPFYEEFVKKYPDLSLESEDAFEIFYNSSIGRISRMVGVGLKDRTTNVIKMIKFLIDTKTPYEALEETSTNHTMHKRFAEIDTKFKKYIGKAKEEFDGGPLLVFRYSGETSMSADIANKLSYLYPDKTILVAFIRGVRVNLSLRGDGVRDKATSVIKEFSMATCGGHEKAVGAQLDVDELDKFISNLKLLC